LFKKLPPQQRRMAFFNPEFVRDLMDYYTHLDEVREVMNTSSLAGDNIFFSIVIALIKESFAVYTLIMHLLSKMKGTSELYY